MVKSVEQASGRLPTGVPGLDAVLCGGLTAGAVFIVQGSPGAGKTILANQICFHHVAGGRQAVYVSLLAESHDRLIAHLGGLSFFDAALIPDSMYFISGFDILSRDGLVGILKLLRSETRGRRVTMMVLDGLFALREAAESEAPFRKFINDLSTLASMLGCTILLLTNTGRDRSSAEYTMVDGWLELQVQERDIRSQRLLQVHKFRGSPFLSGRHSLVISDDGITVLPRLEATAPARLPTGSEPGMLSTGLAELDRIIGGGLPLHSTTLLAGPTGVGKTVLGLHFIAAATPQEPALIFGLYESPDQLRYKARLLGMDLEQMERSGALEIVWRSATENLLDELGYGLVEAVRRVKPKRLFLDGIDAFRQSVVYPERLSRFMTGLNNVLRHEGVTTMYTSEIPELIGGAASLSFGSVTAVAENIVLLRYLELDGALRRTVAAVKVRVSGFDERVHTFSINEQGIRIGAPVGPHPGGNLTLPLDRPPNE